MGDAASSSTKPRSTSCNRNNHNKNRKNNKNIQFPAGEEIDRLVAQAMLELSPQDRERALEELHGVVEVDVEDPSFISSCLDDLDNCLATIKANTAYEEAERMSYSYVSSNRFRMMFLRSVRYVPQDAAERMINFFEYKKELFGRDKMVKDLTFEDLHPEDRPNMEGGYVQVSPKHDQVGRTILLFFEKVKQQYTQQAENAVRYYFYVRQESVVSLPYQKVVWEQALHSCFLTLYLFCLVICNSINFFRFDLNFTPTCPSWKNQKKYKKLG